MAETNFNICD